MTISPILSVAEGITDVTPARRALAIWLITVVATWLLLTAITVLIDPFAVFGSARLNGLTDKKYEMLEFGRIAKPREVSRIQPEAIIIGNSQAEGGLRTATLERLTGKRAYNFSVPGAFIEETEAALAYAIQVAPIRTVVLSLDYVAFAGGRAQADLFRERMNRGSFRAVRDIVELTFSIRGFVAAMRSVLLNLANRAPSHDRDGNWFILPEPIDDHATPVRTRAPDESAYHAFNMICRQATERGIDLRLVATPVHLAFGIDAAERANWLARLRSISAIYGLEISDEGSDARLNADKRNFFDRGHFTDRVGDMILERLFAVPARGQEKTEKP